MKRISLLLLAISMTMQCSGQQDTSFIIISASYNNEEWCQRSLESIFNQDYDNWHLIYINDCSADRTAEYVSELITQHHMWDKVTLINNATRMGHLYNQYHAIHSCANHHVIVNVDGDDFLSDNGVLRYLDSIYSTENVWLTYGQFWYWKRNKPGICRPIPQKVQENNSIRTYPIWITSHLRTFYAGLFKQIKLESLLHNGMFFPMCADIATMIPMIEMAAERVRFIPKVLYIYNDANNLSFFHDREAEQRRLHKVISSQEPYKRLEYAVFLDDQETIDTLPQQKLPYSFVPDYWFDREEIAIKKHVWHKKHRGRYTISNKRSVV